jgi:hypothetical protein
MHAFNGRRAIQAGYPRSSNSLRRLLSLVGADGLEPRPSPCEGDRNMQVSGLTSGNVVTLGTSEYLRVPVSRCAGMVQDGEIRART